MFSVVSSLDRGDILQPDKAKDISELGRRNICSAQAEHIFASVGGLVLLPHLDMLRDCSRLCAQGSHLEGSGDHMWC